MLSYTSSNLDELLIASVLPNAVKETEMSGGKDIVKSTPLFVS